MRWENALKRIGGGRSGCSWVHMVGKAGDKGRVKREPSGPTDSKGERAVGESIAIGRCDKLYSPWEKTKKTAKTKRTGWKLQAKSAHLECEKKYENKGWVVVGVLGLRTIKREEL